MYVATVAITADRAKFEIARMIAAQVDSISSSHLKGVWPRPKTSPKLSLLVGTADLLAAAASLIVTRRGTATLLLLLLWRWRYRNLLHRRGRGCSINVVVIRRHLLQLWRR